MDLWYSPVATIWDRDLFVKRKGTDGNTAPKLDTETKTEGTKLDNDGSDLSMDYPTQEC